MSDLPEWHVTHHPPLLKDLATWCERQCGEAITECVTEGIVYIDFITYDPHPIPREPQLVFEIKDACEGDPSRRRPLDEVLREEIEDNLDGTLEEALAQGHVFGEPEAACFAGLRDVLRRYADALDKLLPPAP